jgi:hypothetical protein
MQRPVALAILLLVCGCASDDDDKPAPCNALPNDGPKVMAVLGEDTAPEPLGGEIANGTYQLVGISYYGDAASLPDVEIRSVFEVDGNRMEQVGSLDDEESHYTSTFSTSGATITVRDSCPAPLTSRFQFTATQDSFFIYDDRAGGVMEQRFDRRD